MLHFYEPTLRIDRLFVDPHRNVAEVTAKRDGIIAWILDLLGLLDVSSLSMGPAGVYRRTAGPIVKTQTFCAAGHISATVYALAKPIEKLISGLAISLPGFGTMLVGLLTNNPGSALAGLLLLLIGGGLVIFFLIGRKRIHIGVVTDSGVFETLKLKADENEVHQLVQFASLLESLACGRLGEGPAPSRPPMEDHLAAPGFEAFDAAARIPPQDVVFQPEVPLLVPEPSASSAVRCPYCNKRLKLPPTHAGKRLRCPYCREMFEAN